MIASWRCWILQSIKSRFDLFKKYILTDYSDHANFFAHLNLLNPKISFKGFYKISILKFNPALIKLFLLISTAGIYINCLLLMQMVTPLL